MKEEIERLPILRIMEQSRSEIEDVVVTEFPLTIILNNQEAVTLLCSPTKLEYLTIGYLWSEGLIESKDEIREIKLDWDKDVVRVKTSGRRGSTFFSPQKVDVEPQTKISASQVFTLVNEFQHHSQVYEATHGLHSAALCKPDQLLIFSEDIGRHNAIDKIFGECLLNDISTDNCLIITSGRVSSEILLKVAKRGIPLLISIAAPTNLGVRLANDLGVTLISFAREKRMNVYTHEWRVETGYAAPTLPAASP